LRSVPTRASQAEIPKPDVAAQDAPPSPESGLVTPSEAISAGAQLGMIQEIGAWLFDFVFQRNVRELYS
jgi:hypothetical protein